MNYILYAVAGTSVLVTTYVSAAGWGLSQPKKQVKSVRQGSTRLTRSRRGFLYVGRSHSYYGGK